MPEQITMPQLSDTMTEGTLIKWLKKEGEQVAEGENIAEVETDKATMEVESFESGTLAYAAVGEGDKVPVGALMGVIATKGEDAAAIKKEFAGGGGGKSSGGSSAKPKDDKPEADKPSPEAEEPAGGKKVKDEGSQTRSTVANDSGGPQQVTMEMPEPGIEGSTDPSHAGGRIKASPVAKRIAEQMGVDLADLKGTGPGGRIVQQDVLNAAESSKSSKVAQGAEIGRAAGATGPAPTPGKPATPLAPRIATGETQVLEMSKMRIAIAGALQKSKQNIPHFYETLDIEMTQASALRQRLNKALEKEGVRLSIGDIIAKAVAVALKANPVVNSTIDSSGSKITRHGDVNLGMAVALPDGLIVPVLRSIDQMGFKEIRTRSADLVDRARKQKLKREEMSGGTFTVSNLGTHGIRQFNAIINPPEVGILAIGASEKRAIVLEDDSIVAREMMTVTLSADHRAVDGADAALFLKSLKGLLEDPGLMLA